LSYPCKQIETLEKNFNISELIARKIKNEISQDQEVALRNWIAESDENAALYNKLIDADQALEKLTEYDQYPVDKAWAKVQSKLAKPTVPMRSVPYMFKIAAVLIPLFIVSIISYKFWPTNEGLELAQLDEIIQPGQEKATLVLADGREIVLDQNTNLDEFANSGSNITNNHNELNYASDSNAELKSVYHTIKTPKGGSYSLRLADGSKIQLNSESSFSYPVHFVDSVRNVYLEGEAYFNVAHNGKPFVVNADEVDIRVLGTSFNVNAYQEKKTISTTLVEGKVFVSNETNTQAGKILLPNDRANYDTHNKLISVKQVDTDIYTSWIDGKLEFNNEKLEDVMIRLSRWYNFYYEFANPKVKSIRFTARIDGDTKISKVLEMIQMTSDISFSKADNKIIIK
jgi:ferric-dicitrate binding protein FerR (iron transport regulator)